jgi:signal transduction histidine kinase
MLLDSAQIGAGKLRIEPLETDLVALVRSVMAQHKDESDHELVYVGPEDLVVMVDPIRFEQVITNLLDNAIKFSPEGGPVTLCLEEGAAGAVRLSITDHGVGIPADQCEHIFDRFHQAHRADHLSGMGLGLFIAREIVEMHGGVIRIEATKQPGSRFVVELPSVAGSSRVAPVSR